MGRLRPRGYWAFVSTHACGVTAGSHLASPGILTCPLSLPQACLYLWCWKKQDKLEPKHAGQVPGCWALCVTGHGPGGRHHRRWVGVTMPGKVGPCGWGPKSVCQRSPGAPRNPLSLHWCLWGWEDFPSWGEILGRQRSHSWPLGPPTSFRGHSEITILGTTAWWELLWWCSLLGGEFYWLVLWLLSWDPISRAGAWEAGSWGSGDRACVLCSFIQEAGPWGVKGFILQCVCMLSHVQLLATLWAVACQALCPCDFPGKNTGVGSHFSREIVPTQGSNPHLLYRQVGSLNTEPPWKPSF